MSCKYVINLKNISLSYRRKHTEKNILKDTTFTLKAGENLGVYGDSASGKSTLAYALCGMKAFDNGDIMCPFDQIGMVMQNPETAFDPLKSIAWTLRQTRKNYLKENRLSFPSRFELNELIKAHFVDFDLSPNRIDNYPSQFSGGELQRIAIIRALMLEPKALILDEAGSMLDNIVQAKIFKYLMAKKDQYQLSYIIISHDINLIRLLCHRYYVFEDTKLKEIKVKENYNAYR